MIDHPKQQNNVTCNGFMIWLFGGEWSSFCLDGDAYGNFTSDKCGGTSHTQRIKFEFVKWFCLPRTEEWLGIVKLT